MCLIVCSAAKQLKHVPRQNEVSYRLAVKPACSDIELYLQRTFLAWLRTSLALASIGVAISQLFRLSSSVYTIGATDISLPSPSAILPSPTNPQDVASAVASLIAIVGQQNDRIQALGTSVQNERDQYHKLGRPIGGAFVCLSLVMMVLGSLFVNLSATQCQLISYCSGGHRYLSVQHHLTTSNLFPPARRSILVSTACIACLLVGTFVSLLVV